MKLVPLALQITANRVLVVDLAVEHQHIAAIACDHRLVPSRAEVLDREAAMHQRHLLPCVWCALPETGPIGTAVGHGLIHGSSRGPVPVTLTPQQSGDSAHLARLQSEQLGFQTTAKGLKAKGSHGGLRKGLGLEPEVFALALQQRGQGRRQGLVWIDQQTQATIG